MTSTFRLTLHVHHPTLPALDIENVLKLPVKFSQSIGMKKKTKTGKALEGVYKASNVSFLLHEHPLNCDSVLLEKFINEQLDLFNLQYIKKLSGSGGSCHLLIGLFSSENIMFELGVSTINRLANSSISLKFDFYGGEN